MVNMYVRPEQSKQMKHATDVKNFIWHILLMMLLILVLLLRLIMLILVMLVWLTFSMCGSSGNYPGIVVGYWWGSYDVQAWIQVPGLTLLYVRVQELGTLGHIVVTAGRLEPGCQAVG